MNLEDFEALELPEVQLNITVQEVIAKPRKLRSLWGPYVQSKFPKSTGMPWKSRLIHDRRLSRQAIEDLRDLW